MKLVTDILPSTCFYALLWIVCPLCRAKPLDTHLIGK